MTIVSCTLMYMTSQKRSRSFLLRFYLFPLLLLFALYHSIDNVLHLLVQHDVWVSVMTERFDWHVRGDLTKHFLLLLHVKSFNSFSCILVIHITFHSVKHSEYPGNITDNSK